MLLSTRLVDYVRAGFAGIWIQSFEHDEALSELRQLCHAEGWTITSWDIDAGFAAPPEAETDAPRGADPLAAIRSLESGGGEGVHLAVFANFHRFLRSPEIVQAVARQVHRGKQRQQFLIVLAPIVELPVELEKLFVCLDHSLPDRSQLLAIAEAIATEEGELPSGLELDQVLAAASGLTRYEAEGAFSLAVCRDGRLKPDAVWELKSQTLRKSGLLSLYRGEQSFDSLGGLQALKSFCLRALRPRPSTASPVSPRGILLLGVPGTGKSAFAKSLGRETGRPVLTLDMGQLMGALVGQTEERTRQALAIADAMQPAILFIDELDKGLAGVGSSGQTDSGVTARMFGTVLTWLNDHESDVFVVCTANDISKLPPELTRAERFDAVFFLDLPSAEQRMAIWNLYLERYQLVPAQKLPDDTAWTGAEIQSCCRLAALLDVPVADAARNIVPIAITASESVARLREWADRRCLSAEVAGIYRRVEEVPTRQRRRIERTRPSDN